MAVGVGVARSRLIRLRLLLELRLKEYASRLDEALVANYPSENALQFGQHLLEEVDRERRFIEDQWKLVEDAPGRVSEQLQNSHRVLNNRLSYLAILEQAQTRRVPWSLVSGIEQLAAALSPERKILVACTRIATYSIGLSKDGAAGKKAYDLLQIPFLSRLDAFSHVLIGHELFHPLVEPLLDELQRRKSSQIRERCLQELNRHPRRQEGLFALGDVYEAVRFRWRCFLKEVACDIGCTAIFGPAAVLALRTIADLVGLDEPPKEPRFHPSLRYRLKAATEFLLGNAEQKRALDSLYDALPNSAEIDYTGSLKSEIGNVESEVASRPTAPPPGLDPHDAIAYELANSSIPELIAGVVAISDDKGVTWRDSLDEIPHHIKRLRLLVPTGEVPESGQVAGFPASFAAVAVAAWVEELARQAGLEEFGEQGLDNYLRSCRLALKSWEDAALKAQVLKRRSEFDVGTS